MSASGDEQPPVFSVRFATHDDFVVAYDDHLRHLRVCLPLAEPLPEGTSVRLLLHLPDGNTLPVQGTARVARRTGNGVEQEIFLRPFTERTQAVLHASLTAPPGPPADVANQVAPGMLDVVIVDDAVSVRLQVADALRERGMRVRVAATALEAVALAIKRLPHAIVSDVEMPEVDGWKLLRMVRGRPSLAHVPVLFLTKVEDPRARVRGYRLGVDDYIPKDAPPEELAARIAAAVARRFRSRVFEAGGAIRGDLSQIPLSSVLSFLELESACGQLHVEHPSGDAAVLHVGAGAILEVESPAPYDSLDDRVYHILGWRAGTFEFIRAPRAEGAVARSNGGRPIGYLLLEFARRADEGRKADDGGAA